MWVMWKIVAPHITLSKRDAFSKLRVRAVLSEQLLSAPTAKPIALKKVFGDLRSRESGLRGAHIGAASCQQST